MPSSAFIPPNKRTIRSEPNPYDKATIVSIFPREIYEEKPTIQPGKFIIPAGTRDKPGILVVGPSSWWREIDEDQPLLEISNGAVVVARALVDDYTNGLFGVNQGAKPGLLYFAGELTSEKLLSEHAHALNNAETNQRRWYSNLVKSADSLWARSNGNPAAIGEDMRLACRELGIADKDWLKNFKAVEMVRCKACGNLRNPLFPVCSSCKFIDDPVKARELGLIFSGTMDAQQQAVMPEIVFPSTES